MTKGHRITIPGNTVADHCRWIRPTRFRYSSKPAAVKRTTFASLRPRASTIDLLYRMMANLLDLPPGVRS